ncbi:MAG: type II toxin-antitoxin system RelE/ParE family toxin [Cytophagales bacterium]
MNYLVEYDEEVQNDLQKIMDWYANQRKGLDREFIENVKTAVSQLAEKPIYLPAQIQKSKIQALR